jgi:hypothetical protein
MRFHHELAKYVTVTLTRVHKRPITGMMLWAVWQPFGYAVAQSCAYAIVDNNAISARRESSRVCCTTIGTSDSKTDA